MRLSSGQLHPRIERRVSGRVDALCVYKPSPISGTTSLFQEEPKSRAGPALGAKLGD